MNPLRSIVGVLAALGLFRLIVAVLETSLVGAAANAPVTNEAEYFAVRNQPGLLAAAVGYNGLAAFLAGYVAAKVAGTREMTHAAVAAAVQTVALTWGFTAGEYAAWTPVWLRVTLIVLIGPAMLGGAAIRARAATINP